MDNTICRKKFGCPCNACRKHKAYVRTLPPPEVIHSDIDIYDSNALPKTTGYAHLPSPPTSPNSLAKGNFPMLAWGSHHLRGFALCGRWNGAGSNYQTFFRVMKEGSISGLHKYLSDKGCSNFLRYMLAKTPISRWAPTNSLHLKSLILLFGEEDVWRLASQDCHV